MNDNSRVDWWAQVVYRGYRRDRRLYIVSMMYLREYESSSYTCRSGRNYLRHWIRKSSPSLADDRTKSAKLTAWSWILSHRASEIYFIHPKIRMAEDDTHAYIVDSTRRVVFVIYRKFGERARNIRESHRQEMQLEARFSW